MIIKGICLLLTRLANIFSQRNLKRLFKALLNIVLCDRKGWMDVTSIFRVTVIPGY